MTESHTRVLVVDSEPLVRDFVSRLLDSKSITVRTVETARKALDVLRSDHVNLVLFDWTQCDLDGETFLQTAKSAAPHAKFVATSPNEDAEEAVTVMRLGAWDYLSKPFRGERLRRIVEAAGQQADAGLRAQDAPESNGASADLIGGSQPMMQVRELIRLAAACEATVLITGETGTGKELVAHAIHDNSDRTGKSFIRLNSAALPDTLYESELFGHEKGAFTGADQLKKGRFEHAHGGTLLLDEVSEIATNLQAKLLRVLQEKEFERIGGSTTIRVDTRVVATSNRDLSEEIRHERFRADLYYRLSVFPIHIAPLRERKEDIPELVHYFLRRRANGSGVGEIEAEAMELLARHDWPGNVRQLENTLERAAILSRGTSISPDDLGDIENRSAGSSIVSAPAVHQTPVLSIHDMEVALLLRTLEECDGNRTRAARRLGITTRTLRNKLHRLGLMDFMKGRMETRKNIPPDAERSTLSGGAMQ